MHSILAARSDFSPGESIIGTEQLVELAEQVGAKAVGLTDTMSVTGMIDFSKRAQKAGIKPIIGTRLRLIEDVAWRPVKGEKAKQSPEWFMTAYARTEAGMKSLFRLITLANSETNFYYTAKLAFTDLYAELKRIKADDLAFVMGDTFSVYSYPKFDELLDTLEAHGALLFAPLVPVNTPYFDRLNDLSMGYINAGRLAPLVIRPALYGVGEADAAEVMNAVVNNNKLSEPWHKSTFNRDFHVMGLRDLGSETKAAALRYESRYAPGAGAAFSQGLKNTKLLVDAVSYQWEKAPISLPAMAPNEFEAVRQACAQGWKQRFTKITFGHQPTPAELREVYLPRLSYELEVLRKLNFSGYFLLVQDVVNFAKSNGILVGPGRGSVGGSLVAYLMGITDCDPIRFGLLFERFINPDRIDLPDADLDFMSTRRHEVVEYLVKKYGQARVGGVSNFGTLGPASAIRDVGRVSGIPERDYSVSKLAPKEHGASVPLSRARGIVPEIDQFASANPQFWPIMERLEGNIRNFATHAAGVVVGGVDLVERGSIERRKDGSVVCWDKRIVEEQGLVKMDILGLSTLDHIKGTLDYIRERSGARPDMLAIPLDDEKVLANFAAGNTTGIFQFESGGMRRLLKELGADGGITFDDITAATALYRPGPMESGMMDSFWKRKQGQESIDYDHPLMEPILSPTFGIMVYQEQVMQVSRTIAGYTAPEADKLRKIMGKKEPAEMAKQRDKFVQGCVATVGSTEHWAGELFDKIEGFAGYGFNKSHSVEYTLISYQAMWLKTYYAIEFYAAALTGMKEDNLPAILRDAKKFHIELGMPDINISTDRFEIANDRLLVMPFNRIKGVASTATDAILTARKAGPFKDKAEFIARVEKRRCNVKVQDLLDRVGAFARIEPTQPSSADPSRVRDQIELLPGLVTATVPIDRELNMDQNVREDIAGIVEYYRAQHGPGADQIDGLPVKPFIGRKPRFMLITDAPSGSEEESGLMGFSQTTAAIIDAMSEAGLARSDVYWTGLIKRPKEGKQVSLEEILRYAPYLQREIAAIKPPIIVLCGTAVVRSFFPDWKGKASEAAGKVVYNKELDANMVIGFNPGEIFYAPEKQELMNQVFGVVADLLP